eukprot:g4740.t1
MNTEEWDKLLSAAEAEADMDEVKNSDYIAGDSDEEKTKPKCSKCEFPAVKGCTSCGAYGVLYCAACLIDHSIHPRFKTHKPCSIEELQKYNEAQKQWAMKYRSDLAEANREAIEKKKMADEKRKRELELQRRKKKRGFSSNYAAASASDFRKRAKSNAAGKIQVFRFVSGARYEGELASVKMSGGQNLPHGYGELFAPDNAEPPGHLLYEGMWRRGQRNGPGVRFWPDGGRWEGQFRRDMMHGSGPYFRYAAGEVEPRREWRYYKSNHLVAKWADLICGVRIRVKGKKGMPDRCATLVARDDETHWHRIKYDGGRNAAWTDLGNVDFTVLIDEPLIEMPHNMKMIPKPRVFTKKEKSRIELFDDIISRREEEGNARNVALQEIAVHTDAIKDAEVRMQKAGARERRYLRKVIEENKVEAAIKREKLEKESKLPRSYGVTDQHFRHPSLAAEWTLNQDRAQWGHLSEPPVMKVAGDAMELALKQREEKIRARGGEETTQMRLQRLHRAKTSREAMKAQRFLRAQTARKKRAQMDMLARRCRRENNKGEAKLMELTPLAKKLMKRGDPETGGKIVEALRKIGDPRVSGGGLLADAWNDANYDDYENDSGGEDEYLEDDYWGEDGELYGGEDGEDGFDYGMGETARQEEEAEDADMWKMPEDTERGEGEEEEEILEMEKEELKMKAKTPVNVSRSSPMASARKVSRKISSKVSSPMSSARKVPVQSPMSSARKVPVQSPMSSARKVSVTGHSGTPRSHSKLKRKVMESPKSTPRSPSRMSKTPVNVSRSSPMSSARKVSSPMSSARKVPVTVRTSASPMAAAKSPSVVRSTSVAASPRNSILSPKSPSVVRAARAASQSPRRRKTPLNSARFRNDEKQRVPVWVKKKNVISSPLSTGRISFVPPNLKETIQEEEEKVKEMIKMENDDDDETVAAFEESNSGVSQIIPKWLKSGKIRPMSYYKKKWSLILPHYGLRAKIKRPATEKPTLLKDMLHVIRSKGGDKDIEVPKSPKTIYNFWKRQGTQRWTKVQQEAMLHYKPKDLTPEDRQTRARAGQDVVIKDAARSFRHFRRFSSRRARGLENALKYAREAKDGGSCPDRIGIDDVYVMKKKEKNVIFQEDGTAIATEEIEKKRLALPGCLRFSAARGGENPSGEKQCRMLNVCILRDEEEEQSGGGTLQKVTIPGESITEEEGLLRGHGTYVENGDLVSSVAGVVQQVNKLITVEKLQTRYNGNVGDVVIGRILEVGPKRWTVDVNSYQNGVLMLSSVILPGGQQRRRTYEDQLAMRDVFVEGDLVSAEVQNFFADGAMSLHTRSLKYGKLENGILVKVAPSLVKRLKKHHVALTQISVELIIGCNGFIWITEYNASAASATDGGRGGGAAHRRIHTAEDMEKAKKKHAEKNIGAEIRRNISRVANSIELLSRGRRMIDPDSIMIVYLRSIAKGLKAKEMISRYNGKELLKEEDDNEMDTNQ